MGFLESDNGCCETETMDGGVGYRAVFLDSGEEHLAKVSGSVLFPRRFTGRCWI